MRRKDREQSVEFALEVCDDCDYAVIGMIDTCGMPYCVAINTVRNGNTIYFHSAKVGFKIDALKNNNNVCLSCVSHSELIPERFTTEYKSAVIRGCAFEVFETEEKIHALRLLCEKFAKTNMAEFDNALSESISHTGIWKIEITEISGKCNIKN